MAAGDDEMEALGGGDAARPTGCVSWCCGWPARRWVDMPCWASRLKGNLAKWAGLCWRANSQACRLLDSASNKTAETRVRLDRG